MRKQFKIRQLFIYISMLGTAGFAQQTLASGYQLWEQDGASVGNYHAGRAAIAADASTAYYNPAGLVRIHNQQFVIAADPITTDFLFKGTIAVNTLLPPNTPQPTTAQGGTFNVVPAAHYAAPLCHNLVFGLSAVSPFGLKTDYGTNSFARYAATLTELRTIDIAPALGFALNDKLSFGLGADLEYAKGNFNLVGTAFTPLADTAAKNTAKGHAWGYHLGMLYQFNEQTRLGLSYHSKVTQHLNDGKSTFKGPLANNAQGGVQSTDQLNTTTTLPATTTLSIFHTVNPTWDVMGSVIYTQWSVFKDLVLQDVTGVQHRMSSDGIIVIIPENYSNSWNYSVGANYHVNPQLFFRTGLGFDQTPANDEDRNLQLPDSDRIIIALGGHYQATKSLGVDLGWSHFFVMNTRINDLSQAVGDQVTTTNGSVHANADVYALQLTWDFV